MSEYTVVDNTVDFYCCKECSETVEVQPVEYQYIGGPTCCECGLDMIYIETRQYNNVRIM